MALTFGTGSQVRRTGTTIGLSFPFTFFCWTKATTNGTNFVFSAGEPAATSLTGTDQIVDCVGVTTTLRIRSSTGSTNSANATRARTTGDWVPVMCVYASASSRTIYYGTGSAVTDTGSVSATVSRFNDLSIGAQSLVAAGTSPWAGDLACAAIWNAALTLSDYQTLGGSAAGGSGGGVVPSTVESGNLLDYWSLLTQAATHTGVNGIVLTATSTSQAADHPITESGGDTTAPVLSSGSATETGDTTATLSATTDEGNGTLYWVVTTSATEPSAAQVKLGDDHADAAAAYADSDAVGSTGAKTNNATGLTASTAYYGYAMHEDAAANQSDVLYLGTFTTTAANAAPSWSGTPSAMSSKRGQAYTPQDITSLVSDADLDTLAYTITGAPTGVTIHSSTGIISGTPTAAPGVYSCTVEADDGIASPVASSSFNITVVQAELALDSAGYEFGDGSDPATMAVVASTELQVAVYPLTEWPPASAIATATATTGTNGRLADLGDDDLSYGTTYRVVARNAADGETWAWTMTAS